MRGLESERGLLDAVATYWHDSSMPGDDDRHVRRKSLQVFARRYSRARPKPSIAVIAVTLLLVILVAIQVFTSFSLQEALALPSIMLGPQIPAWSRELEFPANATLPRESQPLCPSCNGTFIIPGKYATSTDFNSAALATREQLRQPRASLASVKRYLLHHIVLKSIMEKTWVTEQSTNAMYTNYFTQPDGLISASFNGLTVDRPTTYMYTRTGPGGKLSNIERRIRFLDRHAQMLKQFQEMVEMEGYADGEPKSSRQIIWIVIEDDARIDPRVAEFLEASGQPYLYFAHGPTRWLGVAQWNAAERAVEVLRDTLFGDGPVMNVDDDAKIDPELLRRVWRVKRAISWPVGNLAAPGGWEGAIFRNGTQAEWRLGGLAERIFPIDMNGFAVNSSMIGVGRPVHGPWYVSAGDTGAETNFLEKIYSRRDQLEGICDDTVEEGCWWSWWNWNDLVQEANVKPLRVQ